MPELSEPLKQAKALLGQIKALNINLEDQATREQMFEIFKDPREGYNALYMAVNNLGFGAAQSRFEPLATAEKEARVRVETELRELKDAVRLKQDPDIKKLNEDWQNKLDTETRKLREELETEKGKTLGSWHERDDALLESLLNERKVPASVSKVLARDPEARTRREYNEKGSLTVHQAGQRIPFSPGSGQTHLSLLADEITARPDIKAILLSDGDSGGGVTGGGSQGPATSDRQYYENLRKKAEAERKADQPKVSLKERVKNR